MLADEDAGEKGKKGERVGKRDWGEEEKKEESAVRSIRVYRVGWWKMEGGPDRINFFSSFKEIFLLL